MPKGLPVCLCACLISMTAMGEESSGAASFRQNIRPILQTYCFDCHADGANKCNIAFDEFKSDEAVVENRELWEKAFKRPTVGLMAPANKLRATSREGEQVIA